MVSKSVSRRTSATRLAPIHDFRRNCRIRLGLSAAVCAALLSGVVECGDLAYAQVPLVRVRAETRIELRPTVKDGDPAIEGVLRDDLGNPITERPVQLRLRPLFGGETTLSFTVVTDDEGVFVAPATLKRAEYQIDAEFPRESLYERAAVSRRFDLARANVTLSLKVPNNGQLDLDAPDHRIEVIASSSRGASGLRLTLVDEFDRNLGSEVTDDAGRALFVIPSARLGPPSAGRLRVISASDGTRAEKQAEMSIVRFVRTRVTLEASHDGGKPGDVLAVRGTVTTKQGPLERRAVGLYGNGDHLSTVLTDPDGNYSTQFALPRGTNNLAIQAIFESDSPGFVSARSDVLTVDIRGSGTSALWLLLPMAISGLIFWYLFRRSPVPVQERSPEPKAPPVGIVPAARRTRRPGRKDIRGRVLDYATDRPLTGARVWLEGAQGTVALPVATNGTFGLEEAPAGQYELAARADGFEKVTSRISVPHQGQWSGTVIRLRSYRLLAQAPFKTVVNRLLPIGRKWDIWTNREARDRARSRLSDPVQLDQLHDLVEEAFYAERAPSEGDIESIRARAAEIEPRKTENSGGQNNTVR